MEKKHGIQELASILTGKIQMTPPVSMMLLEPLSLTVQKKDGQYSKRPHVGGETFVASSVYVGKRGSLIYVFKPTDTADYATIEMSEEQATKSLSGFGEYIANIANGDIARLKKEVIEAAALNAEREKLSGHADKYAGFGSW